MEYDQDKVDEMVLALLSLTTFEEDQDVARAWKGYDWVAMDRLHAKGYISDSRSKAKSVVVTVEGVQRFRRPFEKHFAKKEPDGHQRLGFAATVNRAIPKREERTGAAHGPSSPVPQRARNALRLRFAPGR